MKRGRSGGELYSEPSRGVMSRGQNGQHRMGPLAIVRRSVRNGLGAPVAPRGNCQEDWTGPDDTFHAVPSWDILGLQS